jgi:HKD family nuclease
MKALLYESEVLDAFRRELNEAAEAHLAFALISASGLKLLGKQMLRFLKGGGTMRVLVGTDLPTDPDAIEQLCAFQQRFKGRFEVKRFQSRERRTFHPKLAVFVHASGKRRAILGSSNLTSGGFGENFEANLLVDDAASTRKLADYFDELFEGARARQISGKWLESYRRLWLEAKRLKQARRRYRQKIRGIRKEPRESPIPKRIRDLKFAFTGMIRKWPRETKLYPKVEEYGGRIAKKANSMAKADALVHGDILGGRKSTLKIKAARRRNIPIITEEEFFAAVENEKRKRSG